MVGYIQKQCNNLNEEFASLKADIDPQFVSFFSSIFGHEPEALNFWMGENRSVSSLHKDPYDNLYCVIEGEKHFTLIPELYYPYL
jgi:peptidyl-lysine (3S)-dioxygenase / protease